MDHVNLVPLLPIILPRVISGNDWYAWNGPCTAWSWTASSCSPCSSWVCCWLHWTGVTHHQLKLLALHIRWREWGRWVLWMKVWLSGLCRSWEGIFRCSSNYELRYLINSLGCCFQYFFTGCCRSDILWVGRRRWSYAMKITTFYDLTFNKCFVPWHVSS